MSATLASADPDVRLDDLRVLAAGMLERLAREQEHASTVPIDSPDGKRRSVRVMDAIATTRGEAARAMQALFDDMPEDGMYEGSPEDMVGDYLTALYGSAPIPSDTLDAWAKALRSAT